MLVEAIPRLAVGLRTTFPDARIELEGTKSLRVLFPNHPNWEVEVVTRPFIDPAGAEFQFISSSVILRYECLQDITEEDFQRLITCENFGLRGVSVLAGTEGKERVVRVRSAYLGAKGRSRDEQENIAIDILSLLRYSRLLEDRILRSSAGSWFSYEMYHSQYFSATRGRNRYINYARNIFNGSADRVFGQVMEMLKDDYSYEVEVTDGQAARVTPPSQQIEMVVRLPIEVPMLTCFAPLHTASSSLSEYNTQAQELRLPKVGVMKLINKLNHEVDTGHFEVGPDGTLISFIAWKHLTNDLRYYSLDQMVAAVHAAQRLLEREIESLFTSLEDGVKEGIESLSLQTGRTGALERRSA
jgi:hypothetical protein